MKLCHVAILMLALMVACSDDSAFNVPIGSPEIIDIQSNITFPTDTLVLLGKDIPTASPENYMLFNDSIIIKSSECLLWTAAKIAIIIPDSIYSGSMCCVFGSDTTQKFNICVLPYQPFATATIDPGKYLRGSNYGFDDEAPPKMIYINRKIAVSRTELSQRLFEYIMKANPSTLKSANLPVYNVTWEDAIQFCNLLSDKDSLERAYSISGGEVIWNKDATGWRLPTEAEWEFFARAGELRDAPANLDEFAWFNQNSGCNPQGIALKKANAYGIYDALGNVSEWCWDFYNESYYATADTTYPTGPLSGEIRVSRGGSFEDGKSYIRFPARKSAFGNAGIRLVRNL